MSPPSFRPHNNNNTLKNEIKIITHSSLTFWGRKNKVVSAFEIKKKGIKSHLQEKKKWPAEHDVYTSVTCCKYISLL